MEISSRIAAVALVAGAFALPGSASGASVSVEEVGGRENRAVLHFEAAAAEGNRLEVSVPEEADGYYRVRLVDTGAAISPGAGCSGGGSPGATVDCRLRGPDPGEIDTCAHLGGCTIVPGTAWETSLRFVLGDSGSVLEAGPFPANPAGSREASIEVLPGGGNDTVTTSSSPDVIRASQGDDRISTGLGWDTYFGGPAADGADQVDLGGEPRYESDQADYRERQSGVALVINGVDDDGASGEGDNLVGADEILGGAGNDFLESETGDGRSDWGDRLLGGGGDDFVIGGSRDDRLHGGSGDDTLRGGGGADSITGQAGADVVDGGAGKDEIETWGGDDTVRGGPNADQIALGPGADRALGGAGKDLLLGEEGGDRLLGGEGVDQLVGGAGADHMLGGLHTDFIMAGVEPDEVWYWWEFLSSPGPLENVADRIGCGRGGDTVSIDRRDRTVGCENLIHSSNLEVKPENFQVYGSGSAHLRYMIRVPGTVSLRGRGLKPERFHDDAIYHGSTHSFRLQPVGRAKRLLNQTGRLKLKAVVTLRPDAAGPPLRRTVPLRLVRPKSAASR